MIRLDCVIGKVVRLDKVTTYGFVEEVASAKAWELFNKNVTPVARSLMMNFIKYTIGKV